MLLSAGKGAPAALCTGRNVVSVDNNITVIKSALQKAVSSVISGVGANNAEGEQENQEEGREEWNLDPKL